MHPFRANFTPHRPSMPAVRLLLVLLLFSAAAARAETSEDRKAVAGRVFEEIFNQGRFEVADEIYAADFVNHGLSRDVDLREDQAAARGWRDAAPDLRTTVQMMVTEGELVAVLWVGEGTNTGAGNGLPATGKRIKARGITIFRITGGRIREEWTQFDQASLLVQLGLLVPAKAPTP